MEFFGARAEAPIETCLEEVRRSDVVVVIVGLRYGSLVPGCDVSFSEAEYNEAYSLRKPCLVYIRDEDVPILPRHFESNPTSLERLRTFKTRLKDRHTIAPFQNPGDLAVRVVADLSRKIEEIEESAEKARREEAPHSEPAKMTGEVTKSTPTRSSIWAWAARIRRFAVNHPARVVAITVLAAALLAALLVPLLGSTLIKNPPVSGSPFPSLSRTTTGYKPDCASGTLTLDGSAFGSIAQKAAVAYSRQCKNANFEFGYGHGKDSAWGIGQLENVLNDPSKAGSMIAMYDGTTTMAKGLTPDPIGMFIYSVVAHTGLYPGSDITLGALKQLFDEPGCVPGKLAVGLQAGSATRLALLRLLEKVPPDPNMPGTTCSPLSGHTTKHTYEEALGIVSGTSNAIGYMAVDGVAHGNLEIDGHFTKSPNVSVLSIDGVAPTPENVHNGFYHFAAVENLYALPHPSKLAQSFLAYLPHYLAEHQWNDFITCSSAPKSPTAECSAPR